MARLSSIRHARELGFEVAPVRELLTFSDQPDRPCAAVDGIARRHVAAIDRLTALCHELQRALDTCAQGRIGDDRAIEALNHPRTGSSAWTG